MWWSEALPFRLLLLKNLPLRSRDWSLLGACARRRLMMQMKGVRFTAFEEKQSWTVEEVVAIEQSGSTLWDAIRTRNAEVRKGAKVFCLVMIDEIRNGTDLLHVCRVWNLFSGTDIDFRKLFGERFGIDCVQVSNLCSSSICCFHVNLNCISDIAMNCMLDGFWISFSCKLGLHV